jgi:hypothetical protein
VTVNVRVLDDVAAAKAALHEAETTAGLIRRRLHAAVATAVDAGCTVTDVARAAGWSRRAVYDVLAARRG